MRERGRSIMKKLLSFALALAVAGLWAITPARAQMTESELVTRLNRLENQVRQLTGQVEQLQYRNQQLEQQLRGAQPAPASLPQRSAAPQPHYAPPPVYPQQQQPYPQQQQSYPQTGVIEQESEPAPPPRGGRRGDAFDPYQNPNAPGVPRALGAPGTVAAAPPLDNVQSDEPSYIGAPGGRQAGAPLDLGTMSEEAAYPPRGPVRQIPGALPGPPPRNPSGTGAQQMVMAPTNTPKDEYDLAYGYVLRKDYALAEEGLRAFVKKYPNDHLVADANYWLGESLFQRQRYREAAESFLTVSTKFDRAGKAPDSLLRLGQSLAALKEKDAACATLGELPRKYPKAPANVKQAAEKEQKRMGCV
jgi:tol-pal system protein YbgF